MNRIHVFKIIPACIFALFVLCVYPALQIHAELEDEEHGFVQANIRAYCDTYSTEFLYDDRMLLEDARSLSTDVAKASLGMAIGAYNKDCMSKAYRDMKMEKVDEYWTYNRSESIYDNDYAAYTIARKYITDENGEEYILYVIPVKGTSKNAEWYSNFNLGKSGDHEGFYLAEKEILQQLVSYTDSDKYDRAHRIIWVTGHSRGAAIANILAGELTDNYSKWFSEALDIAYPEHILGYTFACPNVSKWANQSYTNIWNYNNPGDIVPSVPLRSWGYYRYGQTIDEMDNIDNISQRFMAEHNGGVNSFDSLQSTKEFESTLSTLVVNEEDFHSDDNRLIFLIGAYFLGGNTDTSFYDLLVYAGRDENTWIMKQIAAAGLETVLPGSTEVMRMIKSISNDADRFNAFFNSGIIEESYGMTNDEFSEWVSEHQSEINEIESVYKLNIETRADLIACMSVNSEVEAGVTQIIQLIEKACRLFYLTDGQITGVIEHGHTQATYGCWMNSLYYGYEGWKGYDKEIAVSIPNNINHIGHQCFYDCDGLTEISINSSTTKYDATIKPCAFYSCENLKKVILPSEVAELGNRTFGDCPGLKEVVLPGDVQYDVGSGQGPFSGTSGIEKVTYIKGRSGLLRGDLGDYSIARESMESLKEVVIGEGITEIGNDAFSGWYSRTDADGNGYLACIETVTWPSTLEKIGTTAFRYQDDLKELQLPESVTEIGIFAFGDCDGLTRIEGDFASGITEIPGGCFSGCDGLEEVIIPDNVEVIGDSAFYDCKNLTKAEISSEVTELGGWSFRNCPALKEVVLPGDAQYEVVSGSGPFTGTTGIEKVTYIKGRSGLLRGGLGDYSIARESMGSLKEVVIGEGITEIGNDAFSGWYSKTDADGNGYLAGIEMVTWPSTLEKIGDFAFRYQDNLTKIQLPESVKEIGSYAFAECTGLEGLLISNDTASIYYAAFPSGDRLTIYGRKNSNAETYANGNNNRFISLNYPYIELDEAQMKAGSTQQLASTIHKSIDETIHTAEWTITGNTSDNTHINETGLLSIAKEETSEQVTVIAVFEDVSSSVEITILPYEEPVMETPDFVLPASLDQIEEEAFTEIPANVVYIPDGCTSIGARAFKDCKNLKQIRIPDGCRISETAFEGCSNVIVFGTVGSLAEEFCRTEGNERFLFAEEVKQ